MDCGSCKVRQWLTELDSENRDAWHRYRRFASQRIVMDAHAGGWWLAHIMRDVESDDLDDVMARVRVLYDTFSPPRDPS